MFASLNLFLALIGACPESRTWAARQPDARTAWRRCRNSQWLEYLILSLGLRLPREYADDPRGRCRQIRDLHPEDLIIKSALSVLRRYETTYPTREALEAAIAKGAPGATVHPPGRPPGVVTAENVYLPFSRLAPEFVSWDLAGYGRDPLHLLG